MPFSPDQLYDLVADVEKYPDFLPWCVGARVRKRTEQMMVADLIIGYKMFREQFTSKVTFDRQRHHLEISYTDGPFKYLESKWDFVSVEGGTGVQFYIDFEFRSAMFQTLIGGFFGKAVDIMVQSFEQRAYALYTPLS